MEQEKLIKKKWDTLIVYDACRYDFFKDMYQDFFDGKLTKAHSPVAHTVKWLKIMFPDKYDISVYSANPRIRSEHKKHDYLAAEHFTKVHDIWMNSWDSKLDTILAEPVTDYVIQEITEGRFEGKNIIWFLQPHYPLM